MLFFLENANLNKGTLITRYLNFWYLVIGDFAEGYPEGSGGLIECVDEEIVTAEIEVALVEAAKIEASRIVVAEEEASRIVAAEVKGSLGGSGGLTECVDEEIVTAEIEVAWVEAAKVEASLGGSGGLTECVDDEIVTAEVEVAWVEAAKVEASRIVVAEEEASRIVAAEVEGSLGGSGGLTECVDKYWGDERDDKKIVTAEIEASSSTLGMISSARSNMTSVLGCWIEGVDTSSEVEMASSIV